MEVLIRNIKEPFCRCPRCANILEPGARLCPKCGSAVGKTESLVLPAVDGSTETGPGLSPFCPRAVLLDGHCHPVAHGPRFAVRLPIVPRSEGIAAIEELLGGPTYAATRMATRSAMEGEQEEP